MIKSEIITHEGNPGPNWLDHCRTLISPAKLGVFAILLTGAITATLLTQQNSAQPAATTNQTTYPEATSLSVEPLETQTYTDEAGITSVQAADGGSASDAATTDAPTTAMPQGSVATPSTNGAATSTSNMTPGLTQATPPSQQQLSKSKLRETVQTTVESTRGTLKQLNGLGL